MTHPATMTETTTSHEVWVAYDFDAPRGLAGTERLVNDNLTERGAELTCADYNAEEADNARTERRNVNRTFYVVTVTSTRQARSPK